jgi:mono/diheme cytochrome c family protein
MRRAGRLLALAVALAAAPPLASGCGGADQAAQARAHAAAARAQQLRLGARVFAEHCQTCHALLGRPNAKIQVDALPLDLDQVQPARAYVLQRLESGGVSMGSFGSTLSAADKRAVTDYVLAVGGREVSVPAATPAAELAHGRALYDQHCQSCHAIAGRPPTHPNPIWAGTDFGVLRPSVLYVEQKVREGQREAMPSFRRSLSWEQVRAVSLYVNAMARRR